MNGPCSRCWVVCHSHRRTQAGESPAAGHEQDLSIARTASFRAPMARQSAMAARHGLAGLRPPCGRAPRGPSPSPATAGSVVELRSHPCPVAKLCELGVHLTDGEANRWEYPRKRHYRSKRLWPVGSLSASASDLRFMHFKRRAAWQSASHVSVSAGEQAIARSPSPTAAKEK